MHVEPMRVRYGDTDQMGVVYYANYLRYFEVARAEWLRAGGLPYRVIEEEGALFPVVEAHVRYRSPARYDDDLAIACWPSRLGAASLRFDYVVRRVDPDGGAPDRVLAEGYTEHACIDRSGKPTRFPPRVQKVLVGE